MQFPEGQRVCFANTTPLTQGSLAYPQVQRKKTVDHIAPTLPFFPGAASKVAKEPYNRKDAHHQTNNGSNSARFFCINIHFLLLSFFVKLQHVSLLFYPVFCQKSMYKLRKVDMHLKVSDDC